MEKSGKGLVAALAGALGCSLLAIAFLLGRLSATSDDGARVAPTRPADAAPSPSEFAAPSAILKSPTPSGADGVERAPGLNLDRTVPQAPRIDAESTPWASGSGAAAPRSPPPLERTEITTYFAQVDLLDDMGAGDPQAFATSLLQSVSSGDFSGFDRLLTRSKSQRGRLQAITPPRACLEHHRLALALSADSVSMLERLKPALAGGDTTALMTLATEGQTLEAQANRLKTMAEAIRRQAGL